MLFRSGIPQSSQKPGVAYFDPLIPGAPGHGEGHNTGVPLNIIAAVAVKRVMERDKLPGTIIVWPGVAEELVASKAWFVRDGMFKDVDVNLFAHVGANLGVSWGQGGGTGGGFYQPGNGVTTPAVIREVKPTYTSDAMRAKVQGSVWVQCVVQPDGTVTNATVVRSLDSRFGLDEEAVKAARQWRFRPGTRMGQPVPVQIVIELTFTLR
mgnify:CR=1 FL=1